MPSMSYCRHENLASDLDDVWERWEDWTPESSNDYEARGRRRIVSLVLELLVHLANDGTYDELDEA